MEISRKSDRQPQPGPSDYFSGNAQFAMRHMADDPGRAGVVMVNFAPGARTAWHTHPLGQLLVITEGEAWVQREGGPKETVGVGDTVWFPAGERHWHGATATTAMTHVAVQEAQNGSTVDWETHVTDEEYMA